MKSKSNTIACLSDESCRKGTTQNNTPAAPELVRTWLKGQPRRTAVSTHWPVCGPNPWPEDRPHPKQKPVFTHRDVPRRVVYDGKEEPRGHRTWETERVVKSTSEATPAPETMRRCGNMAGVLPPRKRKSLPKPVWLSG
uniref:Uncharacterized protein n=1 Tax=Pipistrellus kuhlii TaxID=59472 RepID=A0A7J7X073_PIPKU|nr:hypothetical protein mPipKuh1_010723 [Pipistrellus kuhlii]